jgi:hypothetical protein
MSKALLAQKEIIRGTENSLEGANIQQKTKSPKELCIDSDDTKERSARDFERNPAERPFKCMEHIPLKLEGTFANLCPLSRQEINLPEETRHC